MLTLPQWLRDAVREVDFRELACELERNALEDYFQRGRGVREFETMLVASINENLASMRAVLLGEQDPEYLSPVQPLKLAILEARLQISQPDLHRASRAGIEKCEDAILQKLSAQPIGQLSAHDVLTGLADLRHLLRHFTDRLVDAVVETHEAEERSLRSSEQERRYRLLRQVLASVELVGEVELSTLLRYPVALNHVAVMLPDTAAHDGRRIALAVRDAFSGSEWIDLPVTLCSTAIWIANKTWPTNWHARLHGTLSRTGVTASVSEIGCGLAGLRETYEVVQRVETVRNSWWSSRPEILTYRDVRLEWLLLQSPHEARSFVLDELGALAEDSSRAAGLRMTLRVWLETGSIVSTAIRLKLHEHSVRNRLQRAEETIGHAIGERRTEMLSALRLYDNTRILGRGEQELDDSAIPPTQVSSNGTSSVAWDDAMSDI